MKKMIETPPPEVIDALMKIHILLGIQTISWEEGTQEIEVAVQHLNEYSFIDMPFSTWHNILHSMEYRPDFWHIPFNSEKVEIVTYSIQSVCPQTESFCLVLSPELASFVEFNLPLITKKTRFTLQLMRKIADAMDEMGENGSQIVLLDEVEGYREMRKHVQRKEDLIDMCLPCLKVVEETVGISCTPMTMEDNVVVVLIPDDAQSVH